MISTSRRYDRPGYALLLTSPSAKVQLPVRYGPDALTRPLLVPDRPGGRR